MSWASGADGQIKWEPLDISSDSAVTLIQEYHDIRNSIHPDSLICGKIVEINRTSPLYIVIKCDDDITISSNSCYDGRIILRNISHNRKVELHTFESNELYPGIYEICWRIWDEEMPLYILFRDSTD
jgi:hypothetical protein